MASTGIYNGPFFFSIEMIMQVWKLIYYLTNFSTVSIPTVE